MSLGLPHGHSLRTMARVLGGAPSTVSRESARTTTRGRPDRACTAQIQAAARARQPRRPRKLLDPWRWPYVRTPLAEGCSPEQMAGRLRHAYPDDMQKPLASEPIDVGLSVLPRGALCSARLAALRQARTPRRPRARGTDRRGQIPHMTPMAERPAEGATRTVPGHWAGDLIKGARNGSAVGTRVERTTRLVLRARRDGTDARSVREGCTKTRRHVPAPLRTTLTDDRGNERAEHARLAIRIFFADPSSPWQRGTNENTPGRLRQYLPKGTDLSGYTPRELHAIAHRLNTRLRTCLNFATPLEVDAHLALIHPVHVELETAVPNEGNGSRHRFPFP